MEYKDKANKIIEKYKSQNKPKNTIDEILIGRIEGAVKAIESAEEQMDIDAEKKGGLLKAEDAGYGFTWTRFGERAMHPGITIIEKQKSIISKCIQELGAEGESEKPKGKLGSMMKVSKAG